MNRQGTSGTPHPARRGGPEGEAGEASGLSHDLIVVGTGVAGARAAIEGAASGLRVLLLSKAPPSDSNTDKAQGGIAVALSDEDRVGLHLQDTVAAGAGLCDQRAVRVLVEEGPRFITQLIEWGATFDREGSRLAFTREGAHSARRVLHAGGDSTGQEILRALIARARAEAGITFRPDIFTLDLTVEGGRCTGLVGLDGRGRSVRLTGRVVLATGGSGQVFRETTNPPQATGDGIAMAWRAGAWVRDMEFVQFHPTALAVKGAPRFLLSEALRGEGGILIDPSGHRFMLEADPERAELAPRDVVARAMVQAMERGGHDHVLLDMTGREAGFLRTRFPTIHATCLRYGVDIARDPIPVSPSAHYTMGGVATDLQGRTSIPGLYAAGEVACTGVHGANRLASNSLLEGLVFGARAGAAVVADVDAAPPSGAGPEPGAVPPGAEALPPAGTWPAAVPGERAAEVAGKVKSAAWEGAGIVRSGGGLQRLLAALEGLRREAGSAAPGEETREGAEAGNRLQVAVLVARAALGRRESRGAHYRTDYPRADDERCRLSVLMRSGGELGAREVG